MALPVAVARAGAACFFWGALALASGLARFECVVAVVCVTMLRISLPLFAAWPALAMYDVFLAPERARAPVECPLGCARWADLAGDGNARDQSAVNAKFRHLAPPPEAGRACAMPAYDPGESGPGWCYCKHAGAPIEEDWGYCLDPLGSVPEQINLQFVDGDGRVTVAFVTVDAHAPAAAVAQVGTSPSLAGAANVSGATNFWTQVGSTREYSFHFVPLSGLLPATTYYYRVTSGAAGALWSATLSFTTRDVSKPLILGIFGDMGVYKVNNMDVLRNSSLDLIVHMGDHAYQMSSDDGARGDGYMIAWEGVLTATPWLAVMGNRACPHPSRAVQSSSERSSSHSLTHAPCPNRRALTHTHTQTRSTMAPTLCATSTRPRAWRSALLAPPPALAAGTLSTLACCTS